MSEYLGITQTRVGTCQTFVLEQSSVNITRRIREECERVIDLQRLDFQVPRVFRQEIYCHRLISVDIFGQLLMDFGPDSKCDRWGDLALLIESSWMVWSQFPQESRHQGCCNSNLDEVHIQSRSYLRRLLDAPLGLSLSQRTVDQRPRSLPFLYSSQNVGVQGDEA